MGNRALTSRIRGLTVYKAAKRLPKPLKELFMGLALGITVIVNGFRNGGPSKSVQKATRALWFEVVTQFGAGRAKHQFDQLQGKRGLKIHLGCGYDVRSGWVNIDSFTVIPAIPAGETDTYAIQWDLRKPLALEAGSSRYIYSSHFWEHLTFEDGYLLLKDSYRWLEKGGIFRIVLPDLESSFRAYINRDRDYFDTLGQAGIINNHHGLNDGTNLVDFINYAVYQEGEHKCIYDVEKITRLLQHIGYTVVAESSFDPAVDIDSPLRRKYSFYIEATK
jgi:predicted SAM-dependent methyltransferase